MNKPQLKRKQSKGGRNDHLAFHHFFFQLLFSFPSSDIEVNTCSSRELQTHRDLLCYEHNLRAL